MTPRKVPFFNYADVFTNEAGRIHDILDDVGNRGAFIMQSDLQQFEENLGAYVGARFAIGVANATDGLQMALMAAGIGPEDEVLVSSHTMIATASAVHFAGAIPVPVEVGEDHLLDPLAIVDAISPRTRAVIATQLNGRTADMEAIGAVARERGLLVFEDSAQALGSRFRGQYAGTFGLAGVFSFYPSKLLGCLGDGGAVVTDSEELRAQLLLLRDHGRTRRGEVVAWGFNSRLDNIQAAILDDRLARYGAVVERRRAIANLYQHRLGRLKSLVLPQAPGSDADHFDVFQNYEIEAIGRDKLKRYLADHGVETIIQWGGQAVHQCAKLGFTQRLPITDALFDRMLLLPMNTSLSDEDVDYVCDCIEEFYNVRY